MYVHRKAKLVYLSHMKVGSRAVRDALRKRGFLTVYGHHGGPWHGRQQKFDSEPQSWWWEQDTGGFEYFATVRNHFDIIRTYWHWQKQDGGAGRTEGLGDFPRDPDVLKAFIDRFTWSRVPHFHNRGRLFRFVQEVPGLNVWYYEAQREHLRGFIDGYAPPDGAVALWEHPWPPFEDADYPDVPDSGFVTSQKPDPGGLPWQEYYTPATRQVVEDIFWEEMMELGYTFEGRTPPGLPPSAFEGGL